MLSRLFISLCLLLLPLSVQAAQIVRLEAGESGAITLVATGPLASQSVMLLANPPRLVLDFNTVTAASLALPSGYQGAARGVRFGQFDADTSRVVFDLAAPIAKPTIAQLSGGWRYRVDMRPTGAPASSSSDNAAQAALYERAQDEKPLIVIDAGHGGKDPGAIGFSKEPEKHVTLRAAKALREALLRTGRYRVALTRSDDRFILLPERVNIARRLKADLFISLHADSNPKPEARGLSIYTISETASDEESAALAARENSVDDLSGMDLGEVDKDVADVLIDLAARETKAKSSQLADMILDAMHVKVARLGNAHRFAGFRVLKAPDIPSVLIELGFLTNAEDARLLASPEYMGLIVSSIARGVDAYYVTVKRR